jgi:hypothetical protein
VSESKAIYGRVNNFGAERAHNRLDSGELNYFPTIFLVNLLVTGASKLCELFV